MTVEELGNVLEIQEEILQFSSFTNADAWELGTMIVMEARRLGVSIALRIRLNNGYTVFQYGMDGTTLYNELCGLPNRAACVFIWICANLRKIWKSDSLIPENTLHAEAVSPFVSKKLA